MAAITMPARRRGFLFKVWNRKNKGYLVAFFFFLPALVNFILFRYIPIGMAIRASLWRYSLLGGYGEFLGLDYYRRALDDPIFWKSLQVTFLYVILKVPLQTVLALGLALFVQKETRSMAVLRSFIFAPFITSLVVVSTLWAMMYHTQHGLINSIIRTLGLPSQTFLSNPKRALPAITFMMIWKDVGWNMIILLAGLKGIPRMYYEAALVDGASRRQLFWHITLPLLKRSLQFVVLSQSIFAFQVFVPVYVMTRGGPQDSTKVMVYYIYQNGFFFQEMGYASALSVILLLILLAISVIQQRLTSAEPEY